MTIYIQDEKQFQIVSDGFAATPPQTDYKLMYSVDGQVFYEYGSYSAGEPCIVSNARPGMWFILMGNRGEVEILM